MAKTLIVTIPVYNEEEIIAKVLNDWQNRLEQLKVDFEIHTYNDGSKDNSLQVLKTFAKKNRRVIVHDKKNSGHGPTVLQSYQENCNAEWIFQIDSDNEMGPESFEILWNNRNDHDFLIGKRDGRISPPTRRFISLISRMVTKIFYKKGVWDVNSPYRLMRCEKFKELFFKIPENTFTPNIIISGYAGSKKLRIFETQVVHTYRQTGQVSIKHWKLLKAAVKSFWQVVIFGIKKSYQ